MKLNTIKTLILNKKKRLLKKKIKGTKNSSGRNNQGLITVQHKGGGGKKNYRKIDFYRTDTSAGIVCAVEYDPNRNSNISAVYDFSNNKFFYVLAPKNLKIGDILESGITAEPKLGYSLPIAKIPVGSYVYNVSKNISKPAQISRSAGTFSRLKEKTLNYAVIELNSGSLQLVSPKCYASVGIVSNELNFLVKLKKAGQSRWLNRRPSVRGVAMNPVDHKHGGGEGKKSGKRKIFWGKSVKKKNG